MIVSSKLARDAGGKRPTFPYPANERRRNVEQELEKAFERVRRLAEAIGLPETTAGTCYGTPALLVKGKTFVRMKDAATLVVMCELEEKEMLMELDPSRFFETDHYRGWPAMLVRLAAIDDEVLTQRLIAAWRQKAPKRLAARVAVDDHG